MDLHTMSELAFKNGYKKAAEEIFAEIESLKTIGLYGFQLYHKRDIAELKKKYTEEKA